MNATLHRMMRFIGAGVLNTAFGYCVYALFIFWSLPLWLAIAGSLIAGITFNYVTYGAYVFQKRSPLRFFLFCAFYMLLGLLNYLLLQGLFSVGLTPYWAQLIILPPLAAIAYIGMNWGVFGAWTEITKMPTRPYRSHE